MKKTEWGYRTGCFFHKATQGTFVGNFVVQLLTFCTQNLSIKYSQNRDRVQSKTIFSLIELIIKQPSLAKYDEQTLMSSLKFPEDDFVADNAKFPGLCTKMRLFEFRNEVDVGVDGGKLEVVL